MRDFGVEAETAARWTDLQAKAGDIVTPLRKALGDRSGGASFDTANGVFRFSVAKGGSVAAAHEVARQLGIEQDTEIVEVAYSERELVAAHRRVLEQLGQLLADGKVTGYPSITTNSIVVEVAKDVTIADSSAIQRVAASSPVPVDVVKGEPAVFNATETHCAFMNIWGVVEPYCDQPLRAGVRIRRSGSTNVDVCSVAFAAQSATERYFMTAGHCADYGGGGTWYSVNSAQGAVRDIGNASTRYYGGAGDAGLIRIINGQQHWDPWLGFHAWAVVPNVTEYYPITHKTWGYQGMGLCHVGSQSWAAVNAGLCGTIEATGVGITYDSGVTLWGMTRTTACGRRGDSGGPWLHAYHAVGISSGATTDFCTAPPGQSRTWFEEVLDAEATLGVSLILY